MIFQPFGHGNFQPDILDKEQMEPIKAICQSIGRSKHWHDEMPKMTRTSDSTGINSYEYCLGTHISARPLKSGTNTNNIEQPNKCSDMVQTCANYFPRRQRKPRKSKKYFAHNA
jgi:hypothetical protein